MTSLVSVYLRGVFRTSKEVYFIEPTSAVTSDPHIVFRESDRRPTEEHCGESLSLLN